MEMLYNDFVIRIIKMKMCIDTMDMTSGSLGKRVFRFSIPLILLNLLQVCFNMSDIAVVGKFSLAEALGAIGSTTILVMLFTGFLIGMGNGVNVLAARYIGQRIGTYSAYYMLFVRLAALNSRIGIFRYSSENNEHKRRTDRRRTALSESMLSRNVGFGGL